MNEAVIRSATREDIPSIERLLRALAAALGDPQPYTPDIDALARYGFGEHPVYRALIAAGSEGDTGLVVYFPEFSTWRCRPGLYVQDLYVDPQSRGHGLGRALLTAATREAVAAFDAAYLRLAVHVLNREALNFYQALGFDADPDNRVMMLTGTAFARLTDR